MANGDNDLRDRLAVALDVDDLVAALRIARDVRPWFGVAKVGLELFIASGPESIGALQQLGYKVFLDLKLDDIPTTVERAARIAGSLGVSYLTLHARGGVSNLRAGANGLSDGAHKAGLPPPVALGVTVLTSDDSAPPHILPQRAEFSVEEGIDRPQGAARGSGPRRGCRQDEGRHPARVVARGGQGARPPSHGRDRDQREPAGPRPRRPATRGLVEDLPAVLSPEPQDLRHLRAWRRRQGDARRQADGARPQPVAEPLV